MSEEVDQLERAILLRVALEELVFGVAEGRREPREVVEELIGLFERVAEKMEELSVSD